MSTCTRCDHLSCLSSWMLSPPGPALSRWATSAARPTRALPSILGTRIDVRCNPSAPGGGGPAGPEPSIGQSSADPSVHSQGASANHLPLAVSLSSVVIASPRKRTSVNIVPNAFPATRVSAFRPLGDNTPLEFIQVWLLSVSLSFLSLLRPHPSPSLAHPRLARCL